LHVARRTVDVAVRTEGQLDARASDTARRGHVLDIGDCSEVSFERRCDRAGHDLGARARQRGRDENRGHFDLGQRRNGQQAERRRPAQRDADCQQDRRHGPRDEWGGDIHAGKCFMRSPP